MRLVKLRVTPARFEEVEGLGEEIKVCSERNAEFFQLEELQPDGSWLTLEEYRSRSLAERAGALFLVESRSGGSMGMGGRP